MLSSKHSFFYHQKVNLKLLGKNWWCIISDLYYKKTRLVESCWRFSGLWLQSARGKVFLVGTKNGHATSPVLLTGPQQGHLFCCSGMQGLCRRPLNSLGSPMKLSLSPAACRSKWWPEVRYPPIQRSLLTLHNRGTSTKGPFLFCCLYECSLIFFFFFYCLIQHQFSDLG